MKLLLTAVNAKYIHSNLAVYSLKSYAKKYENEIVIGEYTINQTTDYILEQIYRQKPDVLLFSCYIWNLSVIEEIITEYGKLCPNVPIWLGGPEVSYEPEQFLREHLQVKGIVIGEGERTFEQLCRFYVKQDISEQDIFGIAYRSQNNEIVFTKPQQALSMNEIPFCYENIENFENRIIYYESSRGCPFRCSYCLSSIEKQLRFRDINLVKQELQFFINKKVSQVKFVDRTFNCNHQHAMEIWNFIKEHDNGVTNFHFEIAADLLNEQEIQLLNCLRPGLVQLEIGVQSANNQTIEEIHRAMNLDLVKETVKKIQSAQNIHEHLDLIAGLPYENYETFAKSFDEIYELKPNQLQLGFLKVLKGSYMYEHAKEYELVYHKNPPYEVLKTKWLSFDDVLKIKQVEEMLEVYYNSGQFEVTMKLLEVLFESPFFLFQKLGQFYEENGYFGMSHSRIRRCGILLEFLKETLKDDAVAALIEESLVFDLYYRENCKSRPSWAHNPSDWKNISKHYCKNKFMMHVEMFHYHFPGKNAKTISKLPKREKEPVYVLFDYENREKLSHQADAKEIVPIDEVVQ